MNKKIIFRMILIISMKMKMKMKMIMIKHTTKHGKIVSNQTEIIIAIAKMWMA